MERQEDEEGANYSYDIPIDELLDSVSDGEKEAVEEKPGLGSVPHQLDEPQEEVVNHPGLQHDELHLQAHQPPLHHSHIFPFPHQPRGQGDVISERWKMGKI